MKAKKMTYKEFKEILRGLHDEHLTSIYTDNEGNLDFESILNSLSIHEKQNSQQESNLGFLAISRTSMKRHDYLFNALDKRGYFDDVLN